MIDDFDVTQNIKLIEKLKCELLMSVSELFYEMNEKYEIDLNTKNGITNSELRKNYENYCIRNNLSCDTSELAINMGNAIKKV